MTKSKELLKAEATFAKAYAHANSVIDILATKAVADIDKSTTVIMDKAEADCSKANAVIHNQYSTALAEVDVIYLKALDALYAMRDGS